MRVHHTTSSNLKNSSAKKSSHVATRSAARRLTSRQAVAPKHQRIGTYSYTCFHVLQYMCKVRTDKADSMRLRTSGSAPWRGMGWGMDLDTEMGSVWRSGKEGPVM